jgi:hypothetical protein
MACGGVQGGLVLDGLCHTQHGDVSYFNVRYQVL